MAAWDALEITNVVEFFCGFGIHEGRRKKNHNVFKELECFKWWPTPLYPVQSCKTLCTMVQKLKYIKNIYSW